MPDTTSFTSGMITGGLQGGYTFGLATLTQLEQSKNVTVYQGPGQSTDAFIVSQPQGRARQRKVRQALSDALNRQGIISSVYKGAALMPRWMANPGTFGYGKSVFTAAYDASPVMTQNLAEAKSWSQQAGATGKTFTIGTSSQISSIAAVTGAYQAAAQAIGLKVKLKSVSANNYINFFTDAKAAPGIDGFITVNYGDYADPAALLSTIALPDGSQNYDDYNNPQITALARARPEARRTRTSGPHLVAQAEQLAAKRCPGSRTRSRPASWSCTRD